MESWLLWLIIAGSMVLLECMTAGFLVIWFAVGALFAMVASLFIESLAIQIGIFAVVSSVLILLTKPLVKKFIQKEDEKPNVYTVIGKTALVTKDIDTDKGTGQVKVDSDTWSAKDIDNGNIAMGTKVEILKVEGVKVIVKKID
ncbi:MAG: NfeD family protein [Clostridiales bacterium]|nr:NfeD family protein [Clostridiales bacterium]